MRKVFEHPAFYEVGLCASILNSSGIETTVRNENASTLAGEIPFTAAYPELWILEDERYDEAVALLRETQKPSDLEAVSAEWICAKCGESVPGNFDSCWKCESPRPSSSD